MTLYHGSYLVVSKELYFEHLIDKAEALKRLRYEKPNRQVAFRSHAALQYLQFEGSEVI